MGAARHPFLVNGRIRRWRWAWAVLGTALVFVLSVLFVAGGGWIESLVATRLNHEGESVDLTPGHVAGYLGFALFGLSLVAAPALVLWVVHGQDPRLALSPSGRFDWRHFGKAALAYLSMLLVAALLSVLRDPADVRMLPRTFDHLPWLLLAAIVILPQAFGEDYLFKGYLVRVWGAVVPIRSLIIVGVAGLFASAHSINDDVRADLVFNLIQFVLGEMLVLWLFIRTGSLALTTGLHWMNNVWAFCIVSTEPGQPDTLSLFRAVDRIVLAGGSKLTDPWSWASMLVLFAFLAVLLGWCRSPFFIAPYRPEPALPVAECAGGTADQRG